MTAIASNEESAAIAHCTSNSRPNIKPQMASEGKAKNDRGRHKAIVCMALANARTSSSFYWLILDSIDFSLIT